MHTEFCSFFINLRWINLITKEKKKKHKCVSENKGTIFSTHMLGTKQKIHGLQILLIVFIIGYFLVIQIKIK